ncbi:hypothetical protein DL93DRAFT_2089582 [Clavulina sp. PMI_390]|nr:hypothetical protein DL93DRAFT_2089582 [Clavulina sp. PMI_390]
MAVDQDSAASEAGASVIYTALQNGTFNVFDARAPRLVYASTLPASARKGFPSLLSIASDPLSHSLATGSAAGIVNVYDTRQLPSSSESPSSLSTLSSFKQSDSSIDDLFFIPPTEPASNNSKLLVATGDGFPFQVSISAEGKPTTVEEYAAHADEGVRSIRFSSRGDVWTAGDDGLARKY